MNTESVTRCPNGQAIVPLEAPHRLCTKRLPGLSPRAHRGGLAGRGAAGAAKIFGWLRRDGHDPSSAKASGAAKKPIPVSQLTVNSNKTTHPMNTPMPNPFSKTLRPAAGVLFAVLLSSAGGPAQETSAGTAPAARPATKLAAKPPQRGQAWTNHLGMRFVPVPGTKVLFSVWDTRVKDYAAFVKDGANNGGYDYRKDDDPQGMQPYVLRADGLKQRGWEYGWDKPGFAQTQDHPVVCVSWQDAMVFCRWLTETDKRAGWLGPEQSYRLPTDAEWSVAVGLGEESGSTPREKSRKVKDVYPWGTGWPPPDGAGNYAGNEAANADWPPDFKTIEGYRDGYARTSPVGSFKANRFGLYDMGGNVWQWCEDWYDRDQKYRVLRGGTWDSRESAYLLSSFRYSSLPFIRFDINGFRCVLVVGSVR